MCIGRKYSEMVCAWLKFSVPDVTTAVGIALPYKYLAFFFIRDESFTCVTESAVLYIRAL